MMHRLGVVLIGLVLVGGCASKSIEEAKKEQDLAQIYANMGLEYLRRGEVELAVSRLERAKELDPQYPTVHHYLASAYARLNKTDLAETHFREALRLNPDDPNLENNFGVFLCERGRLEEAEQYILRAAKHPAYSTVHLAYENLAVCAMRLPDVDKAEAYFKQALSGQPRLPNSLVNMARIQYNKGDYFKARAYFERYLSVGPATAKVLWLGVLIEYQLNDKAMLNEYAGKLKSEFPASEEAKKFIELEERNRLDELKDSGEPIAVTVSDEAQHDTEPPVRALPSEPGTQSGEGTEP